MSDGNGVGVSPVDGVVPVVELPASESDEWGTPQALFDALEGRFGKFAWDLAATQRNSKCGERFFSKEQDSVMQDWHQLPPGPLWCNPPYSKPNMPRFTTKARDVILTSPPGRTIVMLCPASTSEGWFQKNVFRGADVLLTESYSTGNLEGWGAHLSIAPNTRLWLHFLAGRLSFDYDGVKRGEGAKKGSVILAFSRVR